MLPGELAPVLVISVLALMGGATLILRGPLGRALARRIEGPTGGEGLAPEPARRLEALEGRLTELEERLDFTERLLTRVEHEGRRALPD